MRTKLKKKNNKSQLQKKIEDVKSVIGKALRITLGEEADINKLYDGKDSFENHLKRLYEMFHLKSQMNSMEIKLMEQDVLKKILVSIDKKVVGGDSLFFRSKAYREFSECGRKVSSGSDGNSIPAGQSIHIGVNVNNEHKQLAQYSIIELKEKELVLTRQLKVIKEKKE